MKQHRTRPAAAPLPVAGPDLPERLIDIRRRLRDPAYLSEAVAALSRELSIEIMEKTYGVPFR